MTILAHSMHHPPGCYSSRALKVDIKTHSAPRNVNEQILSREEVYQIAVFGSGTTTALSGCSDTLHTTCTRTLHTLRVAYNAQK